MRPAWARYGVAILAVIVALVVRLSFKDSLANISPFRLFFASVMLGAAYGGFGPGILAAILSTFAANFYFIEPPGHFKLLQPGLPLRLGLFLAEGIVISILSGLLHSARRRAEASEAALLRDAVERRRLERQVLEISDAEQQRIGSDLHDGLGQHLTGIAFMTKVMQQKLAARSANEADDAQRIASLVNQAIGWTRDLARGLATVELKGDGLAGSLRELAARSRELLNLDITFEGDSPHLDEASAVHLFRIAQEGVTNAIRHGKPKRIRLTLDNKPGTLTMRIEDDGIGIPDPERRKAGMGLQIMNYRARMIGATLEIGRRPEGGTQLVCRLPHNEIRNSNEDAPDEREQNFREEKSQGFAGR